MPAHPEPKKHASETEEKTGHDTPIIRSNPTTAATRETGPIVPKPEDYKGKYVVPKMARNTGSRLSIPIPSDARTKRAMTFTSGKERKTSSRRSSRKSNFLLAKSPKPRSEKSGRGFRLLKSSFYELENRAP